jgi:hypothetical protein
LPRFARNDGVFAISSGTGIDALKTTISEGGEGRTTDQMKLFDTSLLIYEDWSQDVWFFPEENYPLLKSTNDAI